MKKFIEMLSIFTVNLRLPYSTTNSFTRTHIYVKLKFTVYRYRYKQSNNGVNFNISEFAQLPILHSVSVSHANMHKSFLYHQCP